LWAWVEEDDLELAALLAELDAPKQPQGGCGPMVRAQVGCVL
jgi:hypothetical protein